MTLQYTPYAGPLLASALVSVLSAVYVRRSSDRRPVTWYAFAMVGMFFWALLTLATLTTTSPALKEISLGLLLGVGTLTGSCWGIFCLYYTGYDRWVSRELIVALTAVGVANLVLGSTNRIHGLLLTDVTLDTGGEFVTLDYRWGPLFWVMLAIVWGMYLAGSLALFRKFLLSRNVYRKISFLLFVSSLALWIGNILSVSGFSPFPHLMLVPLIFMVFGFVGLVGIVSVRFFRLFPLERLLGPFSSRLDNLVPLARDYVVEDIDSGVIILDNADNVVDVNTMAKKMLGTDNRIVGKRAEAVVPVEEYFENWAEDKRLREQIWVEADSGEQRCYDVSISTITGDSGDEVGRAVVMNDITDQKEKERALREREQELQTLKQVYSRILRHNIRNDMNVVRGNAEWIARHSDDGVENRADRIVETADDLASTSKKTHVVDKVVGTDSELVERDVQSLVRNSLMGIHQEFPDADVRTDVPEDLAVQGNTYLSAAIENAVENAIRHNNSDAPVVEIRASDVGDVVELEIRDNGPGIPEQELEAIASGEETALVHTSGIGLWLIDWIVRNSGGEVDFSNDEDGLVIYVELAKAS
jgi:PAS domain S-box-containing protein